jgi:hypothetical protein
MRLLCPSSMPGGGLQTGGRFSARQRVAGFCVAVAGLGAVVAASSTGASLAVTPTHSFTLYSRAEQEQYVNNQDDRTRGKGNNPFGNYRDTSGSQIKSPNGPFPGDESVFSFNLYFDSSLTRRAGTATFLCQYNFEKNAFCDALFRLSSGETVLAEGSFGFTASTFTLAVTGGYGGYDQAKGTVSEKPSQHHAQRLDFRLA